MAITIDSNTYGTIDPYVSGAYAVAEAIRNVIAVGAEPVALTIASNYGNPKRAMYSLILKKVLEGLAIQRVS